MLDKLINKNNIVIKYGKYEADLTHGTTMITSKAVKTINEETYYRLYLQIKSLIGVQMIGSEKKDISLTAIQIDFMAYVMTKPMDFHIHWKNDKELFKELGKEMDRTHTSLYKSYTQLKAKGYFITTEDKLVIPSNELNEIRRKAKADIAKHGHFSQDITFKFCVK